MLPPRGWKIPGVNPIFIGIFPGLRPTSDLKIGTPVATLPGAWRYRVSAGAGWPGVSILCLGEMESWICHPLCSGLLWPFQSSCVCGLVVQKVYCWQSDHLGGVVVKRWPWEHTHLHTHTHTRTHTHTHTHTHILTHIYTHTCTHTHAHTHTHT